jgi:hypothetical protein
MQVLSVYRFVLFNYASWLQKYKTSKHKTCFVDICIKQFVVNGMF